MSGRLRLTVIAAVVLTVIIAAVAIAEQVEDPTGAACANATGDAECRAVALSGTGDAAGYFAAASATGNATGFTAVSGTENASGAFVAASATGNATAPLPMSAAGQCRQTDDWAYRSCMDATYEEDAQAYWIAASGTGNAEGFYAGASGTADARGCIALSGTGSANSDCSPSLEVSLCDVIHEEADSRVACRDFDSKPPSP